MRAVWLLLTLAVPVAAGASFLALPAPSSHGAPCGAEACFALRAEDATVRIGGGRAFTFLAVDGRALLAGSACGGTILVVPPDAVLLRVDPAPCA